MSKRFVTLLLFMVGCFATMAQTSTQGKEFYFSFMRNGLDVNGMLEIQVMISAKRSCVGKVCEFRADNNEGWSYNFSVEANGVTVVTIPNYGRYVHIEEEEQVANRKSLKLVATDTVSVYISNHAKFSFDASYVLPVESLGSEYIIQNVHQSTDNAAPEMKTSSFLIIALEEGTQVDINPSVLTLGGHEAGQTFSVTLNKGQSYFVRSNYTTPDRDLSGTTIVAHNNKKIAVFNGNTLAKISAPAHELSQDHVFEQAISVEKWGKQFIPTTSQGRTRDIVKVTSSANSDTVWINGDYVTALDFAESYEFSLYDVEGSCFIETTEPSMVYLYNTTGNELEQVGDNVGDPSMVLIPPVEQRIYDITFCTFNNAEAALDNHYVNIVVPNEGVEGVYLDGNVIDVAEFQPIVGNDEFSYVRKEISHGKHQLTCLAGVIAHVYGFARAKGYAYCAGANMITLNTKLYVDDIPSSFYSDGVWLCVDEEAEFKVQANYNLNKVTWDFGLPGLVVGEQVMQSFPAAGDYTVNAYLEGVTVYSQQLVYDTLSVEVHVGEPKLYYDTLDLCKEDSCVYHGSVYYNSGEYVISGQTDFGCDSTYFLSLEMGFTPDFEIQGNHWPIGGSETHISVNEYVIQPVEPRAHIDTVLWQVDCPNWRVEPHGSKGKYCTLYIHSYLLEPVTLHAMAINRCDTVQRDFSIQTSYFDLPEAIEVIEFEVAPNPCDGRLTLRFGNMVGSAEIEVYNSIGQKTDAIRLDLNTCKEVCYTMTNYDNGLYYFVLKHNGRTRTKKVALIR